MSPIKPGDLVRTPSGATGTVVDLNRDGSRDIVVKGEIFAIRPQWLVLVRPSLPRPWPDAPWSPRKRA